jgi:hypothetical protein
MTKKPKKINIEILYKDKDLLVLNKPAGLITHPDGRTKESSLSEWLLKKYPKVKGVGENLHYDDGRDIEKYGIVHRLDRETSGAIVVALNQETFLFLKEQFLWGLSTGVCLGLALLTRETAVVIPPILLITNHMTLFGSVKTWQWGISIQQRA